MSYETSVQYIHTYTEPTFLEKSLTNIQLSAHFTFMKINVNKRQSIFVCPYWRRHVITTYKIPIKTALLLKYDGLVIQKLYEKKIH